MSGRWEARESVAHPTIIRAPTGYMWVVRSHRVRRESDIMLKSAVLEVPEHEFDEDDWDDAEEIESDDLDVDLDDEELEVEDDDEYF
jgi:hypothetical protein